MIGKKVRKTIQQLLLMLCILKKEKNNGDFLCMNCPYFFRTKKRLESHKKVRGNKDFCNVIMPSKYIEVFDFNQYKKSGKALFTIYADVECVTEKIDGYKNNSENSSTTKVSKHTPSGFSMSRISPFRSIENKHNV